MAADVYLADGGSVVASKHMPRLFISYRRDDAAADAGRLADHMREHYGQDHVFIDVESIDPGIDFPTAIENAIAHSDVLLAVIGKQWVTAAYPNGRQRLDDPNDYVRLEIAAGLRRNIRVIPVLVCGASMPAASDLPDELRELCDRNAFVVRRDCFSRDVNALADNLSGRKWLLPRSLVTWVTVAAAVCLVGLLWILRSPGRPVPDPSDFTLKLQVQVKSQFGPVDRPPEMKLAHRKPKERGMNLLSAATSIGNFNYEYESPIFMPTVGQEYLGLLHRVVEDSKLTAPRWTDVCFVRAARTIAQEPIVRLSCEEGSTCGVARDDFGWAKDCPSGSVSTTSRVMVGVAFAEEAPARRQMAWVVPSLATLRRLEVTKQNPAFTEFVLSSGPLPILTKATRLTYAIRVNGTSIYIDGLPPETNALDFSVVRGVNLSFGLENLDFSGLHAGYEDIELALNFVSDEHVIRTATVHLRYAALRPMPETAATGDTDLGIRWRAEYHRGRKDDVYEIFLLSTPRSDGAMAVKKRIDASKLVLGSDTLIGVVRPPLATNPSYGVVLGVARPSGQVKFTFDEAESLKLCSALVRLSTRSSPVHGAAFRRNIDNRNFSRACSAF